MRRWYVLLSSLLVAVVCFATVSVRPKFGISAEEPNKRVAQSRQKPGGAEVAEKAFPEEPAVRRIGDSLFQAYKGGDAKAFAALFTAHGEFVDAKGIVFHGRHPIETEFASLFKEMPGSTIELDFDSIRLIAPGVVAVDCTTRFKRSETAAPVPGRCHIVCTRDADRWLVASLKESDAINEPSSHHVQVSQLEWMVGEWISEGQHEQFHFSCKWDESGNYLLRNFTVHATGKETISGTQRIGYDPVAGHLKMWVFDSAGGFSDGHFYREGESWILRTSGVTADGRIASTTNTFTQVDKSRITSETTDRVIGGERIFDTEKLTILRKPTRQVEHSDHGERHKK